VDIREKIGLRIKQLRDQRGLAQKDLAYDANLDRSYIAGVETGQRNISIRNIEKIAVALQISVKSFFDADEFDHD
jgi:transcriptional regulator with XRE-family HTH domain